MKPEDFTQDHCLSMLKQSKATCEEYGVPWTEVKGGVVVQSHGGPVVMPGQNIDNIPYFIVLPPDQEWVDRVMGFDWPAMEAELAETP